MLGSGGCLYNCSGKPVVQLPGREGAAVSGWYIESPDMCITQLQILRAWTRRTLPFRFLWYRTSSLKYRTSPHTDTKGSFFVKIGA